MLQMPSYMIAFGLGFKGGVRFLTDGSEINLSPVFKLGSVDYKEISFLGKSKRKTGLWQRCKRILMN